MRAWFWVSINLLKISPTVSVSPSNTSLLIAMAARWWFLWKINYALSYNIH